MKNSKSNQLRSYLLIKLFYYYLIFFSSTGLKAFHSISYTWYTPLAVVVVLLVGCIVSLITGPTKSSEIDSNLTFSIVDWITRCLPKFKNSSKINLKSKNDFEVRSLFFKLLNYYLEFIFDFIIKISRENSNQNQKSNEKHSNIQIIENMNNVFATDDRFTIN